jgi:ribulose-phosphate 3-epimerase
MTVNPGFGGQKFISNMISKIERMKERIATLPNPPLLEVDGGITVDNIGRVSRAGADIFVAGSSIFTRGDYGRTIQQMKGRVLYTEAEKKKAI